mgnify:FL=1|jgi:hypothetical protein|tara:strand:+ start:146 stop:412 length:267 start_codon:yes stop_codon:yes gene_type:complete
MIEFLENTANIIILISLLLNLILLIGVRNLLKQNEQFEDTLIQVRGRIANTLQKMRDLDNREVFEKDDEVGVTFSELKKLIEDLNNEI